MYVVRSGASYNRITEAIAAGQIDDEAAFLGRLTTASGGADLRPSEIDEMLNQFKIDYQFSDGTVQNLDFPLTTKIDYDADKEEQTLDLLLTFFQPSMNYATVKFSYSFTQTYSNKNELLGGDSAESTVFSQEHVQELKFKAIAPLDI